jgi:osmotically-inducible protein OsmY
LRCKAKVISGPVNSLAHDLLTTESEMMTAAKTCSQLIPSSFALPEAALAPMNMLLESETTLEIEHRILERITGRVRNFRVVRSQGRLILEGTTASFHAKQLVTHAALEFAPDDELVNAITVDRQVSDCIPNAGRRY